MEILTVFENGYCHNFKAAQPVFCIINLFLAFHQYTPNVLPVCPAITINMQCCCWHLGPSYAFACLLSEAQVSHASFPDT